MSACRATGFVALLLACALTHRPAAGQDAPLPSAMDRWTLAAMEFVQALEAADPADAARRVVPALAEGPMSPAQLETIWGQIRAQLGSLEALRPLRSTEQGEYRVVELAARFTNQAVTLVVPVDGAGQVAGFRILPGAEETYQVPPYADTTAFTERDVTVGTSPWSLGGTFSVPRGDGPFPAVVLVHGSGPNDRDQTIGPNRPFRDLAWGLASNGIAVLRYDKRTRAHGHAIDPLQLTLDEEVLDDALHALALARTLDEVDPAGVFVLGHSLGASLAPAIATRDGRVAGAILMAAVARPFADVLREQIEYLGPMQATTDDERALVEEMLERIAALQAGSLPDTARVLGMTVRYLREVDAAADVEVATRLEVPLLVLQGERDYQVTLADLRAWQKALSGRDDVRLHSYPALDHLFMTGTGPSTPEQYMAEQRKVAPEVVADIAGWVHATR